MLMENLRGAYRSLCSAPGFTATAVLSLAIGMGGSIAMFTLVNSIVLKPLAYQESDKLVVIMNSGRGILKESTIPEIGIAALQVIRWRKQVRSFESFAVVGHADSDRNLTGSGHPERLGVLWITAGFFETLRVRPQRGRWFTESDENRDAPNVVILSDSLWRRRFAADAEIIGRKVVLNDVVHEVVGIAPSDLWLPHRHELHPTIQMPDRTDIFLPIRFSVEEERGRFEPAYVGIARLKPGVTPVQARAELDSTLPTFREFTFTQAGAHMVVKPFLTAVIGDVRKGLMLLLASVGIVLLIACANIANLSLIRATQRSRELAMRAALGAGRGDLIKYSLTESFLLGLCGTAVGSVLSMWITDVLISYAPAIPRLEESSVDSNVIAFAVGVCGLTTILFGLLPALRVSRVDPQQTLGGAAGRGTTDSRRGGRLRAALISAEVALGTLLVIGSGLLLTSFHRVMNVPRGFDGGDILITDLALSTPKYQGVEKQVRFIRAVHDELTSIPGVMNIAVNTRPPLTEELLLPAQAEGRNLPSWELPLTTWPTVSSQYFGIMRIPLRAGRLFRDDGEAERVAVISESAAQILWPGEDPIGKRVLRFTSLQLLRVIGVVGDVRSTGLDRAPKPAIYRLFNQTGGARYGGTAFSIVLRSALPPDALAKPVRDAIWRVDPDTPVPEIRSMPSIIVKSVHPRRFQVALLSAFGSVAVLLAVIGIYGVVAYSVAQRRKEIGLRIALGAKQVDIGTLVFRNGMAPVFIGLGTGLLAATFFTRLLASLLFEVSTLDPLTFVATPLVLVLAAAVPCWLTARHAAQIDPVVALRLE